MFIADRLHALTFRTMQTVDGLNNADLHMRRLYSTIAISILMECLLLSHKIREKSDDGLTYSRTTISSNSHLRDKVKINAIFKRITKSYLNAIKSEQCSDRLLVQLLRAEHEGWSDVLLK